MNSSVDKLRECRLNFNSFVKMKLASDEASMGRPRKKKLDFASIRQRFLYLLENLWGGNRAQMAIDLGFSHTAINNIANGIRDPGRRVLEELAKHPKVNASWLMNGEGAPLLEGREIGRPEGAWHLPISRQLLPGPPQQHREKLTDNTLAVAPSEYRADRYLLEILRDQPIVQSPEKIAIGDLLLMETVDNFGRDTLKGQGAICAITTESPRSEHLQLGRVSYSDPSTLDEVVVDLFGGIASKDVEIAVQFSIRDGKVIDFRSFPQLRTQVTKGQIAEVSRVGPDLINPPLRRMKSSCVVAVCLRVIRREP